MTKKIFKSIVLVSSLSLLFCIVFIFGILNEYFSSQLTSEVENEAALIASGVQAAGIDYLDQLNCSNRVTWIAEDGSVLYDSFATDESKENHADRQEIIEAKENGSGLSLRYSETMERKSVNYALLLSDNTIVRVSSDQYSFWVVLLGLFQPLCMIFLLGALLALVLSIVLSKRIIRPINEIDLENPDIHEDYEEIAPLLHKMKKQNQLIHSQMEKLVQKQEEFRAITENMAEGFLLIDKNAAILSYNNSAIILLGSEQPHEKYQSAFTLNRSDAFRSAVQQALDGRQCETALFHETAVYQILANPIVVNGENIGAVIIILDITEKEKRDEMRREFSANVSHELKTPLTSIYGISEIMMNGLVKSEDFERFAKDIHDESGRLITLIDDIIKLSHLDNGALPDDGQKVDLYETAMDVVERLRSVAEKNEVQMTLTGEHAWISGSPTMISEIIYNLCDNAIKYNRKNGTVTVSIDSQGKEKILRIKDTGVGIPDEQLPRIFERFYRVDKSHSKAVGGTGLGLSIVKHGVEYHHAKISVQSKIGAGTSFTIVFNSEDNQ